MELKKQTKGIIYYLQNPITSEVFYIGATATSLEKRLKKHYTDLNSCKRGERKNNKRFEYLEKLLPNKAEINVLEIVSENKMYKRESFYIKLFRQINPELCNMTDGGRGNDTIKYKTEKEKKKISKKISESLKGRKKPKGFSENLSKKRKGKNNPMASKFTDPIVANEKYIFYYSFEINGFIGSKHAAPNILKQMGIEGRRPYKYKWNYLSDLDNKRDLIRPKTSNQ